MRICIIPLKEVRHEQKKVVAQFRHPKPLITRPPGHILGVFYTNQLKKGKQTNGSFRNCRKPLD